MACGLGAFVSRKVNNTMLMLILVLLLALPACSQASATLPPDWISTRPPDEGSEQALCANWADDEWTVEASSDGAGLSITPAGKHRDQHVDIQGGRLVAENRGEFGGDVWWEPAAGQRQAVAKTNLVAFIPTRAGLFGLTGLAHLLYDAGAVVRFDYRPDRVWEMHEVLNLTAAPFAFAVRRDGTVLVVLTGKLALVRLPNRMMVLYRNPVWRGSYPNSVAEDRAGTIYLGMRSAVA
jgi:hypothetical protein